MTLESPRTWSSTAPGSMPRATATSRSSPPPPSWPPSPNISRTRRADGPLLRLVQQQDARCPPPVPAVGSGSAPPGRFATTTAEPSAGIGQPKPRKVSEGRRRTRLTSSRIVVLDHTSQAERQLPCLLPAFQILECHSFPSPLHSGYRLKAEIGGQRTEIRSRHSGTRCGCAWLPVNGQQRV